MHEVGAAGTARGGEPNTAPTIQCYVNATDNDAATCGRTAGNAQGEEPNTDDYQRSNATRKDAADDAFWGPCALGLQPSLSQTATSGCKLHVCRAATDLYGM